MLKSTRFCKPKRRFKLLFRKSQTFQKLAKFIKRNQR